MLVTSVNLTNAYAKIISSILFFQIMLNVCATRVYAATVMLLWLLFTNISYIIDRLKIIKVYWQQQSSVNDFFIQIN